MGFAKTFFRSGVASMSEALDNIAHDWRFWILTVSSSLVLCHIVQVTQEMSTVSDAMREYTKEEVLSGNEQWFCEKCKAAVEVVYSLRWWSEGISCVQLWAATQYNSINIVNFLLDGPWDDGKAKVDTKKKIDLWQLPPVLVIHLKRTLTAKRPPDGTTRDRLPFACFLKALSSTCALATSGRSTHP